MKTHLMTLVSLSFSVLLAGACAQEAAPGDTGGTLTQLSNGPDLPPECVPCWDEFQDCFAEGSDMEECAGQIVQCVEDCNAPPPPPECLHCAAGFDACAEAATGSGDTAEDCAVGFEGCLAACEGESVCDENPGDCQTDPPDDECGSCDQHFDECVNDEWADPSNDGADTSGGMGECEQVWADCYQHCEDDGGDGGNDGTDEQCQLALQACEASDSDFIETPGGESISCDEVRERCLGEDPTDPDQPNPEECNICEGLDNVCTDAAGDSEECQERRDFCVEVCGC